MNDLFSQVRAGLDRTKGRWPELSALSGISYSWISKCGAGKYDQSNVGHRTLEKLAEALKKIQ